jgi:D-aminopeptidase-like protein
MRVVVFGDMEGVAGICRWEQVSAGGAMCEEGRALYTAEMNAAVRGAFDAGADEVVVYVTSPPAVARRRHLRRRRRRRPEPGRRRRGGSRGG